ADALEAKSSLRDEPAGLEQGRGEVERRHACAAPGRRHRRDARARGRVEQALTRSERDQVEEALTHRLHLLSDGVVAGSRAAPREVLRLLEVEIGFRAHRAPNDPGYQRCRRGRGPGRVALMRIAPPAPAGNPPDGG